MHLTTTMMSTLKMIQMRILNFNLTMTWKTLTFHSLYMVTSTPWCFMCQFNLPTFYNYIYWIQYAFDHNGNDCSNYSSYGLDNPSYVSSSFIMYPSLKDISIACNLNQKQHAMFMLVGHMLLNSYDNLTPSYKLS
jgi:hypothetical protein